MADLTRGQGGNKGDETLPGTSAHAQSSTSGDKLEKFIARGETILENFMTGLKGFEDQAKRFNKLEATVSSLNSKRKANTEVSADTRGKKSRPNENAPDVELSNSESESDVASQDCLDDVDNIFDNKDSLVSNKEDDFLAEVEDYFQAEQKCGHSLNEGVARTVNMALRGTLNREKMKAVFDRNKRPENVAALQIPKVPNVLWDQLSNTTKSVDANRQKMIGQANQALTPIVNAMNYIRENSSPDVKTLTQYIGDAFKILASQVTTIKLQRHEFIRTELNPQFRGLCSEDHPISATQLFGDNFGDAVKSMDQGKTVKLTMKSQSGPFFRPTRGQEPQAISPPEQPNATKTIPEYKQSWLQQIAKGRDPIKKLREEVQTQFQYATQEQTIDPICCIVLSRK